MAPGKAAYDPDIERSLCGDCYESDPPATILMFVRLYWDDSKTAVVGPFALMTLGGWGLRQDKLRGFARRWQEILRDYRVTEAKASALLVREGEFKGWSDSKVAAFQGALSGAIQDHMTFGVACSVIVPDYERVIAELFPKRTIYRLTYVWLMQRCMENVSHWDGLKKRDRLIVVPDDMEFPGRVKRSFYELVDDVNGPIGSTGRFVRRFIPAESHQVSGIQASDMLASGARLGTEEYLRGLVSWPIPIRAGIDRVTLPILGGYQDEANMRAGLEPYRLGLVRAQDVKPLPAHEVPISASKKRRKDSR